MGHILLLILKILGILILIILGLLIFVIASVLFIPVRYSLAGKKTEKEVTVKIRFHWFLHILSFYGGYDGEEFSTRLRIFGIPIKPRKESSDDSEETDDDTNPVQDNSSTSQPQNKAEEQERLHDNSSDTMSMEEGSGETGQEYKGRISNDSEKFSVKKTAIRARTKQKQTQTRKKGVSWIEKIKNLFHNLKCTWKKICAILKKACASTHSFLEFVQADTTKQTFSFIKEELKYLFHHLKPRRIKGELIIGFEDPSMTGQFLAASSLFYPLLGERIKLYPDFEHEVLEGTIQIKGYVRAVHALRILWHFYRNKNMMQLIKKFSNYSE